MQHTLIVLCLLSCTVLLAQPHHGNHGGHHGGKHSQGQRLDAFKKALVVCQADTSRLCSHMTGTFMKVRCLAIQSSNLSPACKTALFAAIRRPHGPSHGPSPPTTPGQNAIDRNCLRSAVKKCMPATIETMLDPDATNGADLIACAKAHSKTISPQCEIVIARMAKDGFAENLFTCGQKALALCSAQTIQLMGAEMGTTAPPVLAAKVMAWVKCMQPKTAQLSSTCRILVQALTTAKSKILPAAGTPSPSSISHVKKEGYATEDTNQDEGDSPAAAIAIGVSVLALLILGLAAATFYWKRKNQTQRARQAGIDFSRLEDQEALTAGGVPAPVVVDSLPGGATVVAGTPVM